MVAMLGWLSLARASASFRKRKRGVVGEHVLGQKFQCHFARESLVMRAQYDVPAAGAQFAQNAIAPECRSHILGRLATFKSVTRPNRVRSLRLIGSPPRFPPDELLHPAPVRLHARMSNLHGELLSVHEISQA